MMNFRQLKTTFIALSVALMVTSCGPVVQLFDVDVKVPPRHPLELANKSLAVFSNIGKGNDSLLMVNLATGISASLEKKLSLEEGAIPVYNFYPDSSDLKDILYIQSLSQKSSSDILMVVDSMNVGLPEQVKLTKNTADDSYNASYMLLPIRSVVNVYDGISADKIASIDQTDTVYWEVLSRNDLRTSTFLTRVYESLDEISKSVGANVADNFFDTWENVERYLYCFDRSKWIIANEKARDFEWRAAMEIWLTETGSPDKLRSACAAFNLAVACEMNSRKDLALRWIEYSKSCYPLHGIDNYESILKK
ncbi:MAG: DUF6340 family protein [Bacteroidales bacterium]